VACMMMSEDAISQTRCITRAQKIYLGVHMNELHLEIA